MKLLIVTGAYPPMVGGSAYYAKNIYRELSPVEEVSLLYYKLEKKLPTGIRHLLFFFRTLARAINTEQILALDTFSSGLPAVFAAKILGKKITVRVGGDFLWEQYIERTGDLVPLPYFYGQKEKNFTIREKVIYKLTKILFQLADKIIFNSPWQKNISQKAYDIPSKKIAILENVILERDFQSEPKEKTFFCAARDIKLKNLKALRNSFAVVQKDNPQALLCAGQMSFEKMLAEIKVAYAVILISVSDISPDLISQAIQYGKPFIVTKYNGLPEEIQNLGVLVDPKNQQEIQKSIQQMLEKEFYDQKCKEIRAYTKIRSWQDLSEDILKILKNA